MHRPPQQYGPAFAEEMILNLSPFASLDSDPGQRSEFQRLLDATWGMVASAEMQKDAPEPVTRSRAGTWALCPEGTRRLQDERVLGAVARRYMEDVVVGSGATLGSIECAKTFAWRVSPGTDALVDETLGKHAFRIANLESIAKHVAASQAENPFLEEAPQSPTEQKRLPRWRRAMNFALGCIIDGSPRRVALTSGQYSHIAGR